MERDGRCVRDIEARERTLGRDAAEAVACLSRELAQAFALGAKHQGEGEGQCRGLERLGSFLGKSDPEESCLAKLSQALRQIPNQNNGHDIERAARRLGERAGEGGRMPLRQHDARRPEGSGGAQYGADILRVGDLVEHEQDALGAYIVEFDRGQGLGLEHDALVHGVRSEQPVELFRKRVFCLDAAGLQCGFEPARGVLGGEQPSDGPARIGKGCLDGVDAVEQDAVGIGRPPRISRHSMTWPKAVLRLVFGAWQGGEDLSGVAIESAR